MQDALVLMLHMLHIITDDAGGIISASALDFDLISNLNVIHQEQERCYSWPESSC